MTARIGEIGTTAPQEPAEGVRVWRITHKCPACLNSWSYDILAASDPTIPDDVQLGPWMLCGSCEARRRVNYRQIVNGKTDWWAPFWGEELTAKMWARIRANAGTFTAVREIGEYSGQKLVDEKASLIKLLTRFPIGNGWYRNIISISSEEYGPMKCKWEIPRRPNAPSAGGWR